MKFLNDIIIRTPINSYNDTFDNDLFKNAILISSPSLYSNRKKAKLTDFEIDQNISSSISKYISRAKYNTTPFGLFAGIGNGKWGKVNAFNKLNEKDEEDFFHTSQLDMEIVCSIAALIEGNNILKKHLNFFPNGSLYKVGDTINFLEYNLVSNRKEYFVSKIDYSLIINKLIIYIKNGKNIEEINNFLKINEFKNDFENLSLIEELISEKIIFSELLPNISGENYFKKILNFVNKYGKKDNEIKDLHSWLINIEKTISELNSKISVEKYQYLYDLLKIRIAITESTSLLKVDSYLKPKEFTLDENLQAELIELVNFLNKITKNVESEYLSNFKKKFKNKFGYNETSLLYALDNDNGIEYIEKSNNDNYELLKNLKFNRHSENEYLKIDKVELVLIKLIEESSKNNLKIIELNKEHFKEINYFSDNIPHTFPICVNILNNECSKIQIDFIGGTSGANLITRFAENNTDLYEIAKKIVLFEKEMIPNAVLAEIIHLPDFRVGNVINRPILRDYEIPILTTVNENKLELSDLYISLDKDDNIILKSKKLNKLIIPKLTSAHLVNNSELSIYKFLYDLQFQYYKKTILGFTWNNISFLYTFLPRVTFGKFILSPAMWYFKFDKYSHFFYSDIFSEIKIKVSVFLIQNKIDKKFILNFENSDLVINTSIDDNILLFLKIIRKKDSITIKEFLYEDDKPFIKNKNNKGYTNQMLLFVLNDHVQLPICKIENKIYSNNINWIYYKIYCGVKASDFILSQKIKHITENLLKKGIIEKWFFIRYADPDVHIRFRLYISNISNYGEVIQLITKELNPLLNQHIISKIQTDTYKRELNRYGHNSMELIEDLFYTDSIFIVGIVDMFDYDYDGNTRWKMALLSVDEFLSDFNLNLEEKYNLTNSLSNSFFIEHGGKKELKLTLDSKFRTLRVQLEEVLNKKNEKSKVYYPIVELINERSKSNKKIIEKILLLYANKEMQISIN